MRSIDAGGARRALVTECVECLVTAQHKKLPGWGILPSAQWPRVVTLLVDQVDALDGDLPEGACEECQVRSSAAGMHAQSSCRVVCQTRCACMQAYCWIGFPSRAPLCIARLLKSSQILRSVQEWDAKLAKRRKREEFRLLAEVLQEPAQEWHRARPSLKHLDV